MILEIQRHMWQVRAERIVHTSRVRWWMVCHRFPVHRAEIRVDLLPGALKHKHPPPPRFVLRTLTLSLALALELLFSPCPGISDLCDGGRSTRRSLRSDSRGETTGSRTRVRRERFTARAC